MKRDREPTSAADQLYKELLRAFFREFLELFFPAVAARLDFSRVTFLDKELFTDIPAGRRREADVVAEVSSREGTPELVLVHVEVEGRRRPQFPERMFRYYCLLRLRRALPVYPIALVLGRGAAEEGRYEESLFGELLIQFRYRCVSLGSLEGEPFLSLPNPLAPALAASMRPGAEGRARHKALCLLGVARAAVDEARRFLLQHAVERALKLRENEQEEFEALLDMHPLREVREMISPYETRYRQMGREEGRNEEARETLLRLLHRRFGELPPEVMARVAAGEAEWCREMIDRLFDARSLDDLGLD